MVPKYENSIKTLKILLKTHWNIKKEEKTYHPRILMFCCFFSPNNTTAHRVLEYVWSTAGSRPKTSKKISTRVIRIIPIWSSLSVCCCILALRSLTRKKIVCVDNLITLTIQIVQWIYVEFLKTMIISFSSSNNQFYESRTFCLFTFWVFFPYKSFNLILKYIQKCSMSWMR